MGDDMYRILLVEDDPHIREMICDHFHEKSKNALLVDTAESGQEGVEKAYENAYDILILDVMLPELDGFEICREVRRNSDVPIIFLTARVAEEDMLRGYALGCDDYVTKPFPLSVLYEKVNALIKRAKGLVRSGLLTAGGITVNPNNGKVFSDHISYLQRNEIPEVFLRHTFGSNNLRATAQQLAQKKIEEMNANGLYADDYIGLLQVNDFEYIYYDAYSFTTRSINTSSSPAEEDMDSKPVLVYLTNDKEYVVYYARRFNVLEGCIGNILTVTGILFLFFLIICVILIVMMWRTLKMQIVEEQKRRDMTNALAHDIKTPLFILSGYAGNLKENVQTDKREHYADVIVEQTEEVNRRVNRMLELSKLDSPNLKMNKEDFDLAELTAEIISNYEALPDGKAIDFAVNTPDGKCYITADRELIKRAIENLVDNAVKYSDSNTVIEVIVTGKTFTITNTCSAMQPANMKSLMEAYRISDASRTAGHSSGTGLGLSITKTILNLHHMTMNCRVKEGIVTFRIHLQ